MESSLEALAEGMADVNQKHFALTHIVYTPGDPLGVPLALLSVSPIFLFVAYFALVVFGRRLSLALLAIGSFVNEVVSLALKRTFRAPRPFPDIAHVGHGYGMPSSHAQAGAFLLAWSIGYTLSLRSRYLPTNTSQRTKTIGAVRAGIYLFGVAAWSLCVAYSRYALHYHSIPQIAAGYGVGLLAGAVWYALTEHIPLNQPQSLLARIRKTVEWLWTGVGGIGGWQLGGAPGGWGEGWMFGVHELPGQRKSQ